MKLPELAACMLVAAALYPWLGFPLLLTSWICSPILFFVVPRKFRVVPLIFSLCLLWVFLRGFPGVLDLQRHFDPEARSTRLMFQVRGDSDDLSFYGEDPERWVPVRIQAFYQSGEWRDAVGRVQIRLPAERAPDFLTGTSWEASGILVPGNYSYVGLFRADWLFRPDPGSLEAVPGSTGGWFLESIFRVRENLSAGIERACRGETKLSATLQALLLGRRNELDRDTLQLFVRTGLVHVFAVSGLHLGLLCSMLMFGGRWAGVSPRWIPALVLPLLVLFTLYTGLRASALRALIMIACLLCSIPLQRQGKVEYAFALALVLILGIAPAQIYDLGFQYSFLLVGSLLAFAKIFSEQIESWFAPDSWAPLGPARQFRHRYLWPRMQGAILVSLLCFVISAPLTAHVFNLFSPVGIVGNLLAVPLVFLLLATGFPALFFVGLPETVSSLAFFPARWSASALLSWVEFLEKIPGGTQWVKSPPLWMLYLFYGALFFWWRWPQRKQLSLAVLVGLGTYAGTTAWLDYRRPELGILDTDRGQSLWFRMPGKGIVLVDTGSDWDGRHVTQTLKQQGIDRIECLILTHPDRNHVGGSSQVLDWRKPKQLMVAAPDKEHPLYEDLLPGLQPVSRGDLLEIGGWTVEVLHPSDGLPEGAADTRSLVLRFTNGFSSVLIMGGAGAEVESELLEQGVVPAARLLVAGNPRDGELLHKNFLQEVDPEVVLYSGQGFTGISPGRKQSEFRTLEAGIRVLRIEGTRSWILFPGKGSF